MNDDERTALIGTAVKQLAEVKRELACYRFKASQLADGLRATAQLLAGDINGDVVGGGMVFRPVNADAYQFGWPTLQQCSDVILETRRLTAKIDELEGYLRDMGHR